MIRKIYRFLANKTHGILWGPRRYRYLFKEIRKIKPRRIMEIGTWNGNRALQMIKEAAKFHSTSNISYYGFDLFEEMTQEKFVKEISKMPPSKKEVESRLKMTGAKIHLFKGDTIQTLSTLAKELPKMDFVFIDGGHSLETVKSDWESVKELMHSKTVVIFDDYWNREEKGAKPVVDKIDTEKYLVKKLPIIDRFKKEDGMLSIQFVLVKKRK